jgi:hypothetical protein
MNRRKQTTKREVQPQGKMTKNIMGQQKEYLFVKSVNSMEELDKFRFKVIQIKKIN